MAVCLACMGPEVRPHHVICRPCYDEHANIVAEIKTAPLPATEIRKKLWGQNYLKNRTPRNRTRIAYGAYHLAAEGDGEILLEVRAALMQHGASDDPKAEPPPSPLTQEAEEVAFLESKLREGRATDHRGPGSLQTMDGHFVRSKSERDIANFLFQQRIPYQYERPTWIGGVVLRPDFYLPDTREDGLFLEHFGLLENPDYRALAARKAQLFQQAGRRLIATDETDAQDMDAALRLKLGPYVEGLD